MATEEKSSEITVKVFKYRWIILFVYCAYTSVNFTQFLEYSIIANIISKYYNVSSLEVDMTSSLYFVVYIAAFIPCNFFIQRYKLRWTAIIISGLTTAGILIKLLSVSQDRFYVVLLSQLLCAIAQVFTLSIITKLACVWFGPTEVSTACAICVLGSQIGVAIGCIVPSSMVKNSNNMQEIHDDLFLMLLCFAVVTSTVFILTVVLFKERPELPPSLSQANLLENEDNLSFLYSMRELVKNRDFLVLLVAFGIANGIWTMIGVVFNKVYLEYFPGAEQTAGILALSSVILGGCIGSVLFGYALDKTHKFRLISFGVIFSSAVIYIFVIYVLEIRCRNGSYILIPTFGFFMASTMVVSYEYIVEVTYPIKEEISCATLNATIFAFSLIFMFIAEALYDTIGYMKTNIIVDVLLFICSFLLFLVGSDLHRRDANQSIEQ